MRKSRHASKEKRIRVRQITRLILNSEKGCHTGNRAQREDSRLYRYGRKVINRSFFFQRDGHTVPYPFNPF